MSNMSYCRFENTLNNLKDCAEALYAEEELSDSEQRAKEALIRLCEEITQDFGGESVMNNGSKE